MKKSESKVVKIFLALKVRDGENRGVYAVVFTSILTLISNTLHFNTIENNETTAASTSHIASSICVTLSD